MQNRTTSVSFRLASTYAKLLAERAEKQGDSVGEHARRLVIDALTDAGREELRDQVGELTKLVHTLREDLATAAVALLSQKASYTRDEAEAWAKRTLLH